MAGKLCILAIKQIKDKKIVWEGFTKYIYYCVMPQMYMVLYRSTIEQIKGGRIQRSED